MRATQFCCPQQLIGFCLQATSLRLLRTDLTDISPVLCSLTNLLIFQAGPNLHTLCQLLPQLHALETLSLGVYEYEVFERESVSLHLDGLKALKSLQLDTLVPSSIRLSKSCKLHIFLNGRLYQTMSS